MEEHAQKSSRVARFREWSRLFFIAGVATLPFFLIPVPWVPLMMGKIVLFTSLIALSVFFLTFSCVLAREFLLPRSRLLAVALLLPLAYLISWILAGDGESSFFGTNLEADTVFGVLISFLTLSLAVIHLGSRAHIRTFLWFVGGATLIPIAFQYLQLLLALFGLQVFGETSFTLAGKWNDLAILTTVVAFSAAAYVDFGTLARKWKIASAAITVLALFLLILINLNVSFAALFFSTLFLGATVLLSRRTSSTEIIGEAPAPSSRPRPLMTGAVALISLLLFFFGSTINARVAPLFSISEIEARTSLGSTFALAMGYY